MTRVRVLLTMVMMVLAAAGCRDATSAADRASAPGPGFARSLQALDSLGPGWRTSAAEPHACFTSVENRRGSIPYLYRRFPLRLPAAVQSPTGAVTAFRFRSVRADGSVRAVINCVIPATPAARAVVARRFRIPLPPESGGLTTTGCVIDNSFDNPCRLEPVIVIVQPEEEAPPCDFAPVCDPDPTPPGGSAGGGTGGCTDCGPNAPRAECPAVQRGQAVRCEVFEAGDLDVISWNWSNGTSTVPGVGGKVFWWGIAVASGDVSVRMRDGTVLVATLSVADRGWAWATHAVSEYRDGTGVQCLNYTPTFGLTDGYNLPLGAANCTVGRRQIQPDSYDGGDGFVAATVSGNGPNRGLHYITSAQLSIQRESTYNSGVFASAPWVPLNPAHYPNQSLCGYTMANWNQFNRCMQADVDGYIAGLRAHEGWGSNGTNGHFSAAVNAASDPNIDPMVMFDGITGTNTETLADFIQRVRVRVHRAGERAEIATLDIAVGGTLVTGNWSGQMWRWSGVDGRFFLSSTHSF